jgi:hypothetical protein
MNGIEIPEPHSLESRSENRPNRCGVCPTFPIEPGDFEMTARTKRDARRRKERIVEPPKPLLLQKRHPFGKNGKNVLANGKKIGREGLGEFGPDLSRILKNFPIGKIDMLQPHRCNRIIAHAGQQNERDQGAVALFDIGSRRDGLDDVSNLIECRNAFFVGGFGDGGILQGQTDMK